MKRYDMVGDLKDIRVMAIVNVTPDSFYAGSRSFSADDVERRIRRAVDEGASILDIGGYSSRPGACEVPVDEEWRRVDMGIGAARRLAPDVTVSVDTFRAEIVRRAVDKWGMIMVNDISAGSLDEDMLPAAARAGVPYIAMHMRGTPASMQQMTDYRRDIVDEVEDYFRGRIGEMLAAGIRRENIILDPGFGFAKTLEQNYRLMHSLDRLAALGYPLLSGISRKSMIYRLLDITPEESLCGTAVLNWVSLEKGATILRVHDVKEAVQVVGIFKMYNSQR